MKDLKQRINEKIERMAEEYSDEIFKLNPKGFTVSPYCNTSTMEEAYDEGAHALAEQLVKAIEALDLYKNLPGCCGPAQEALADLEAWLDD